MGDQEAAGAVEEKDHFFKVRIPQELAEQIRLTCARRKLEGTKPYTQQDIGLAALVDYFDKPDAVTAEEAEALEERLEGVVQVAKRCAAKFRHFGHRDVATRVLVELTDLGFDSSLDGVDAEEPEETRGS